VAGLRLLGRKSVSGEVASSAKTDRAQPRRVMVGLVPGDVVTGMRVADSPLDRRCTRPRSVARDLRRLRTFRRTAATLGGP
jgi:hypothetical protein